MDLIKKVITEKEVIHGPIWLHNICVLEVEEDCKIHVFADGRTISSFYLLRGSTNQFILFDAVKIATKLTFESTTPARMTIEYSNDDLPMVCPICKTDTSTFTPEQQEMHGMISLPVEWYDNQESFGGEKKFELHLCKMCSWALGIHFHKTYRSALQDVDSLVKYGSIMVGMRVVETIQAALEGRKVDQRNDWMDNIEDKAIHQLKRKVAHQQELLEKVHSMLKTPRPPGSVNKACKLLRQEIK